MPVSFRFYRKMVLQGMYDCENTMINSWVFSSSEIDNDRKAIFHLYLGFHHQIKQSSSDENFTRSQQELEKAIEICERSDCKYAEYIMGRAYTYLTQNYYMMEILNMLKPVFRYVNGISHFF